MKIVADENIPLLNELYSGAGTLLKLPGRQINANVVKDADLLLIRSVTKVNQQLLHNSKLRFIATSTIGIDHIDTQFLSNANIGFCSAPGCNAEAVVDYVLSAIAFLFHHNPEQLKTQKVGIVGMGNVGGRLATRLKAMNIETICCDPILERTGKTGLVCYEQLLKTADIITLHTPLTFTGSDQTFHLLNENSLNHLKTNAVLINTSRGAVIDNKSLLKFLRERNDVRCILDVWENEPAIETALLPHLTLATPHIAGYSQEGKIRGAITVYKQICNHFGWPLVENLTTLMPPVLECSINNSKKHNMMAALCSLLPKMYDIEGDNNSFKKTILKAQQNNMVAINFDLLRKKYMQRREFNFIKIRTNQINDKYYNIFKAAGFIC